MKLSTIKEIKNFQDEVHQLAIAKGWYDTPRNIPELLCLVHSEVSEALEAYRAGNQDELAEELADTVIRILDMSGHLNINLANAIWKKHQINKNRPYRHGGKLA